MIGTTIFQAWDTKLQARPQELKYCLCASNAKSCAVGASAAYVNFAGLVSFAMASPRGRLRCQRRPSFSPESKRPLLLAALQLAL